jgi:hypothetical protein
MNNATMPSSQPATAPAPQWGCHLAQCSPVWSNPIWSNPTQSCPCEEIPASWTIQWSG